MVEISQTTQLTSYTTIRDILLAHATLSKKFTKNNVYEFEPNLSSVSFDMLPYMVISTPTTETDLLTLNHATNYKTFETNIVLVMAWEARGNFTTYCNYIIRQIEVSESTFEALGYYNQIINLESTNVEVIQGKQAVVGTFTLTMTGSVERD